MTSFLLDINLWVALNFDRHTHHLSAKAWYTTVPESALLVFCRQTQLGLFRLLTNTAVMGREILTQQQCWRLYDRWIATGQVAWAGEGPDLDTRLRAITAGTTQSAKTWMDAYLAAFAEAASLTLVTFDKALAARVKRAVLLS